MSADLTHRLRTLADDESFDCPWWWDVPEWGGPAPLLREAANEIEKVRSLVQDLVRCCREGYWTDEYRDAMRSAEDALEAWSS